MGGGEGGGGVNLSLGGCCGGGGGRVGEASSSGLSPHQGIPLTLTLAPLSIYFSLGPIKGLKWVVTLPHWVTST